MRHGVAVRDFFRRASGLLATTTRGSQTRDLGSFATGQAAAQQIFVLSKVVSHWLVRNLSVVNCSLALLLQSCPFFILATDAIPAWTIASEYNGGMDRWDYFSIFWALLIIKSVKMVETDNIHTPKWRWPGTGGGCRCWWGLSSPSEDSPWQSHSQSSSNCSR